MNGTNAEEEDEEEGDIVELNCFNILSLHFFY